MGGWREVAAGAAGRVRTSLAPAVQAAAVAGVAWWLAATFLQVPQNFFAPFAAIAVLLGGRGGRGPRAIRVIVGGVVGVGFGELSLVLFGPNAPVLFAVAAVAMLVAAALTADALTMIHAGIGCALVAIMSNPAGGLGRVGSAVIGGVVALVATQVLFTPAPGRLAGPSIATLLGAAADLLERPSDPGRSRAVADALAALGEVRDGLHRVRRFTLRGRWQRGLVEDIDRSAAAAYDLALDALVRARDTDPPASAAPVPARPEGGRSTGPSSTPSSAVGNPAASIPADATPTDGRARDTAPVVTRLRELAGPPSRAGRPGRSVPGADELSAVAEQIGTGRARA